MIDFRIHFGIFYCLWHIFNTNDLAGLVCHEIGDGACTGIEVEDELVACETCKISCHFIELVGLLGIGLVEGLGAYLELQILHLLHDMVLSVEDVHFLVADGIIELAIHHV